MTSLEGCDCLVSDQVIPRSEGPPIVRERPPEHVGYRSIGHAAGTAGSGTSPNSRACPLVASLAWNGEDGA
jgi:hypothetical protein